MESGKGRGNYASAYKLSRSATNCKANRRERRSIEQKELRQGELNKRRNLCDLSPLQEGDSTIAQDRNYKDKTPQKPRVDEKTKKGLDRLEQLKKWKQERDRKRKQEEAENRRRNPVFRVSKTIEHADTRLFGKSATKIHPVKPKPAPVSTKPASQPTSTKPFSQPTSTKPAGQPTSTKPAGQPTSTKLAVQSATTRNRSRNQQQTTSNQRGTRSTSRGAQQEPLEQKAGKKVPVASTRTLRSARQPVAAPEPKSRPTRQSVKNKVPESKFKASEVPEAVFDPHPDKDLLVIELNQDKVTKRGDTTMLPTDSFAQTSDFGFNASSFVFRPLSPASAAGFLCQNQDSSCVSFLETNPKRSSTPKKDQEKKRQAAETSVNTTVMNQTDLNSTQDTTKVITTTVEQTEKTLIGSPAVKNKSVRRSRRSVAFVDIEEKNEIVPSETVTAEKPRRSARNRSAASLNSDSNSKEVFEEEKKVSPVKRRRSIRIATASVGSDNETAEELSTPKGRKESYKFADSVAKTPDNCKDLDTETANESFVLETVTESAVPDNDIAEVSLTTKSKGKCPKSVDHEKRISSDSCVDLNQPSKEITPSKKKKQKSRNKSFGGFRLPDAGSVVLSAKRNPRRKTLMPKSPEEWIEVLSNSPMVEMTRRKHKFGNTSVPTLNFDDVDLDESVTSMETENAEVTVAHAEANSAQSVPMEDENEVFLVNTNVLNESNKENEPHPDDLAKTNEPVVVQVGEVSSTQDGPLGEDSSSDLEQDVPYFRKLLCTETNRLTGLSDHWNLINEDPNLTEEVHGQIRTTVGQAMLLMDQRFKQFSGLVDNCEFKIGEKETTCMDLKGFWEMIYYQVEDVDNKFAELKKLKEKNWIDDQLKPVVKKLKKKITKPAVSKPVVKSKFAAFRAQMKKQKESVSSPVASKIEEEKVFEVPGFFKVASPVRTPKFHCDGGTPKKTKNTDTSEEQQTSKDTLTAPSSSELFPGRTPSRKSYVPAVPSPLLKDTTPLPRPSRSCTQKTPIPKRLIDEVDIEQQSESSSKRAKRTPARRSLRTRKSVNFNDEVNVGVVSSPSVEGTDEDFARLLQPMAEEPEKENTGDVLNDSLSRYLQPLSALEKEDTPKQRSRRASLKGCRSTERRRSRQRSVHFVSPAEEEHHHVKLPHTPYNRDSLVKQKRVTRRSTQGMDDVFSIDNIDNDENVPPPSFRSPRPSLLGTPPDLKRGGANISISNNVPTGTLVSFTP